MKIYHVCLSWMILFSRFGIASPWLPPSTISTPNVDASSPSIAIDLNGRSIAVWIENGSVVSSIQPFQGSWSFPLNTLSGSGASHPKVVVDLNGTATAMWLQNGVVTTASQPLNGAWSQSVSLSGNSASVFQMAIDASGNIVAVWQEGDAIQSATQLINGSWPVSPDVLASANAILPAVSIGMNGTVSAVWQQSDYSIHTVSKSLSGSWGTPQMISSAGVNSTAPQVSVSALGGIVAAWFRFNVMSGQYTNVVVQAAYQPSGGAWTTPTDLSKSGMINPDRLQICVGNYQTDNTLVMWINSYDGSSFTIEKNILFQGSWSGPFIIVSKNLMAYAIAQKVNFLDEAYVGWMSIDGNSSAIEVQATTIPIDAASTLLGSLWPLSINGVNGYPDIGVNINGPTAYGASAWENNNGTYQAIQAIYYAFPVLLPPSSFAVVQQSIDYGIFTQYNNVLTWVASPSTRVRGYVLFRNGVYLATVSDQYIDFNRLQGETVLYSIYAFDGLDYISETITTQLN